MERSDDSDDPSARDDIGLLVGEHVNRTIGQAVDGEPAIWHYAAM
jgi:hypothetical protein